LVQTPLEQELPQVPQFAGLFWRLVSQPFVALPSQLPKPVLQLATAQAPEVHAGTAFVRLHTVPQAPQLLTLLVVFTSQPSAGLLLQSRKPVLQVNEHAPPLHVGAALAKEHALPQAPQLPVLVLVFTSQPSLGLLLQSRKPALHTKEHPPAAHTAEAFAGALQTVPQAPQLRGSVWVLVQLPAHSVSPVAQVARHTPAEQT
jgi:hypothetical protein